MNAATFGLIKKFLPVAMVGKGLSKIDPRIVSFITNATAAGYGADAIKSFLSKVSVSGPDKELRQSQKIREEEGIARPDELANLAKNRTGETIGNLLTGASALAGGLAGLAGLAGQGQGQQAITPEVLPAEQNNQPLQIGQQQQPQIGAISPQPQPQAPQAPIAPIAPTLQPQPQQPQELPRAEPQQARSLKDVGSSILKSKGIQSGVEKVGSYFQRAMEGVDFFSLPDSAKAKIGKISKILGNLEMQKVPYKDKSVQKNVKAIKKIISDKKTLAESETERFNEGYPQQATQATQQAQAPAPQQNNADIELANLLESISKRFKL